MKKMIVLCLALSLLLVGAACGKAPMAAATASPTADGAQSGDTGDSPVVPGVFGQNGTEGEQPEEPEPSETGKRQTTYEPSIFVIEAAGSWQREVEAGYYINYECELYLDKIEPYDMHTDTGAYTGVFWMKVVVDAQEYISKVIKDVPGLSMTFDVSAEGISDDLSIYLRDGYTRDPTADFSIPDGEGGKITPAHEALAGKGSFVVSATQGNLNTHAVDTIKGFELGYDHSGGSDTEVSYVIHVDPDPTMEATERKVKIQLTTSDGATGILDGVWRRLPGYPEDLEKYYDSGKSREILDRHQK